MTAPIGVPLCDLAAQLRSLEPQLSDALVRVLHSGQVINGPEVAGLEAEVAEYCGVPYGVGCSSGSDALLLALTAYDIGAGDEVICPPFTFFATVGAICRTGAMPVFADIDPVSYNIDPAEIAARITPRTKAILIVHLFGQCCDMDAINAIAAKHKIPVIEDACQAIGAEYRGQRTGALGQVACFSFYPSKNLGGYGDGGMCVTTDEAMAKLMLCLRNHGMEPKYHHKSFGWNARLDAMQAALLRVKLPHLDKWSELRQAAAKRYDSLIAEAKLTGFLGRPTVLAHRRHVFNQYVVRVADGKRDALVDHFKSEKVGCEIYYPIPLHLQECLRFLGHEAGQFPVSEAAALEVMALPMFPEITAEQQRRVVDCVAAFSRKTKTRAA
jgi:dTDP-4-amino-4,6-dideoxygalactose transaminase